MFNRTLIFARVIPKETVLSSVYTSIKAQGSLILEPIDKNQLIEIKVKGQDQGQLFRSILHQTSTQKGKNGFIDHDLGKERKEWHY